MRTLLPSRLLRTTHNGSSRPVAQAAAAADCINPPACLRNCRCFARVQDVDQINREVWFNSSSPRGVPELGSGGDQKPPDERTIQLGKSRLDLYTAVRLLLIIMQRSGHYTSDSPLSSKHRCHRKRSPRASACTSSHQRTLTSPPSPAE